MPVTNYYSVEGEILGEKTTGSSRVDYLTDALGSVTATVDQNAQVVNTYRYKPYGSQLSKSGAGSDPKFQWVGTQGYRQTGRTYSDVYVRARHYDTSTGRWTTKDPLVLKPINTQPNFYFYAKSNPIVWIDILGLQATVFDLPPLHPYPGFPGKPGQIPAPFPWDMRPWDPFTCKFLDYDCSNWPFGVCDYVKQRTKDVCRLPPDLVQMYATLPPPPGQPRQIPLFKPGCLVCCNGRGPEPCVFYQLPGFTPGQLAGVIQCAQAHEECHKQDEACPSNNGCVEAVVVRGTADQSECRCYEEELYCLIKEYINICSRTGNPIQCGRVKWRIGEACGFYKYFCKKAGTPKTCQTII